MNSVPTLAGLDAAAFTESAVSAAPQLLDPDVTFADLDGNLSGGMLTVAGLLPEDTVSIRNQGTGAGQIGFANGVVTYEGVVIGFAGGGVGGTLYVAFLPAASPAAVDALIQNLTYANVSDAPTASRTLEITITDGTGTVAIAARMFLEGTGTDNPLDGLNGGTDASPVLVDLDRDGDLDAVVGKADGSVSYFENTGSATAPGLVQQTGTDNPFDLIDVGDSGTPSFADLDSDGDLDAIIGTSTGALTYYKNIGSATAPNFAEQTGGANPLDGLSGGLSTRPTFADIDGDGDLDGIAGDASGILHYFENTGTAIAPTLVERTGTANPFDGLDPGDAATPSFGDIDGDGDLDAVVGTGLGTLAYLENIGSATAPAFAQRAGAANPFDMVDVGDGATPGLGDLDGDGSPDLIVADQSGQFHFIENTTPQPTPHKFIAVTGAANPFNGIDVGSASAPDFADLDRDGDLDAVIGASGGVVDYLENVGSAIAPSFVRRAGGSSPFWFGDGAYVPGNGTPSFADFDGDTVFDIFVGQSDVYFPNDGSATVANFALFTGGPLVAFQAAVFKAPSFADINSDGDADAVFGADDGKLYYLENAGTATAPSFVQRTGASNPFDGIDVGSNSTPGFADLDRDGDFDLVIGEAGGTLLYFESIGTATAPSFVQRTGAANPFDGIDVGSGSTPTFADLDGDGDPDLIVGNSDGTLNYYRNSASGFAFSVNVSAENDAPVAQAGAASGSEDTVITGTLAATDVDGGSLTYSRVTQAAHGTVVVNADGTFAYMPNADYSGADSFTFRANDGALDSNVATVSLTIGAVNDAPVAQASSANGFEDNPINGTLVATDIDSVSLTYNSVTQAAHGTVTVNADGTFAYAPNAGYSGADSFTFKANDGALDSNVATVNLSILTHPTGTPGDDSFTAPAGSSAFDALGGVDTITFGFKLIDATVTYSGNTVVIDSESGHTVLTGFEKFIFTDGTVDTNDGDALLDDLFYYAQNHDVWNAQVDADAHYHSMGWHEGRDPSAFFDTSFYLAVNPDVKAAGIDPLAHWHASGWSQGRLPSLAFDGAKYLAANPDVAAAHLDPLWHFLAVGASEGRQPFAPTQLLGANGFDLVYYLQNNPDVAAAGVDPLQHFQTVGWTEGRNPNALFDTSGYLATYTDVAAAHINPLDHYNVAGWKEGRDPSVGFDTTSYLAAYPDVAAANVNPLMHFLASGQQEGRSPFADGVWG